MDLKQLGMVRRVIAVAALVLLSCGKDNPSDAPPLGACETGSDPNVTFTAAFTELGDIAHIEPLGEVQAFHNYTAHTYVFIRPEVAEVPVYAPVAMDLVNVTYNGTDYALQFRASCEVVVRFAHITNPIPGIRNLATSQGISMFEGQTPTLLSVSAGERIGTTSGTPGARSFDFGVFHSDRPQEFLNNARFHPVETFKYSNCPYDFYTGELRSQMYSLFGPKPVSQPLGCRGPRGVAGTLAGPWFDTVEVFSTPYFGQTEFSPLLVAASLDGTVKIVQGTQPEVHRIAPGSATWADPAQVTISHCYTLPSGGYYYFQLQPDGSLLVAREATGTCPAEFPVAESIRYYR